MSNSMIVGLEKIFLGIKPLLIQKFTLLRLSYFTMVNMKTFFLVSLIFIHPTYPLK